ncbi:cyclic nucleotide-binding domain-containing protein [Hymenobacter sublimis]|uniref:Cyclic nucleotide-binding domain-containing protein n=1 Tax=Hymenobacter sublimis TaxID=2933777 RepID=A0ABY4JCG2_9BACT|nr:cyclic nucleotide-binding domain-containing protein [Hymenobacter sublimis]UPL50161.1 cyclic nucleotide-binding domain-containing protein [Hymenobacter sublimis]
METWQHFLGVRTREVSTVWLFFLHNFLLGIGTVLVYVVANVLLLEHQPERSLPLAYGLSALATIALGKAYAHFEHSWPLKTLATRALLVVVGFTGMLALLITAGHAVVAAVALLVGYRLIYLLTNLEFWGLSAVVFDVRQGRRLFSVISSGDMPAKALGAVLAIFVHARADLFFLLFVAFGAYVAALYTQYLTFRSHVVEARPAPARVRPTVSSPWLRRLLGSNPLVLYMGLSMLAVAAVATGVEYFFFVNVKQKLQDQTTILQYVGGVLALAYLLAMLGKLLLTRHGLDHLGLPRTLLLLPLLALAGVALFGGLQLLGVGPAGQLVYFCGLYLGLEVLRRAVFDPVFLVLFQPLSPPQRLRGHTLVKGFYEPLGMGLMGGLLLAAQALPTAGAGLAFAGMALLLLGVVLLLRHTHHYYLEELKTVLSRRFPDQPHPAWNTTDILHLEETPAPDAPTPPVSPDTSLAASSPETGPIPDAALHHPELAQRQAALAQCLTATPTDPAAQASLQELAAANAVEPRQVALALLRFLPPPRQTTLLHTCLHSLEPSLVKAAVQAAAQTPTAPIIELLIDLLEEKAVRKPAASALAGMGAAVLPALETALHRQTDYPLLRRLTMVCARVGTPASRRVLVALAQQSNLSRRAAALHALSRYEAVAAEAPLFQNLMQKEMRLAQLLLHGMLGANVELRSCLKYELTKVQQRLFGLLLQLYDRQPILDAQRGIARAGQERQANALEILDNLIPRPLYQGLQALVDVGRLTKKVQTFDQLLGPVPPESILTLILQRGEDAFAPWTVSVALRQWQPTPATVATLRTYLHAPNLLVRESAEDVLELLPARYPAVYEHWCRLYPCATDSPDGPAAVAPRISAVERVLLLKHTTLFAQTPENVLSSIVPIMKEVEFPDQHTIFAKGDLGTSLFIIYTGEVGIFTGEQQLATFHEGDFFGELALLDAEPRSATAVTKGPVVAFRLDQEDFYDVMEECAEVLDNILRVLCQRLRLQNEKMRALTTGEMVRNEPG